MDTQLQQQLATDWPPASWQDVTVLVAVSGGADSVALLRCLHALKTGGAGRLIAAHANHGLRGADSDEDAAFVARLCACLDVPCEVGPVNVQHADRGDGLEAAARTARYEFLAQVAQRYGARYVAVAHTADDQAETVLHRILRGTGLAGLAGIPRLRPLGELTTLIRPLLWARRDDVLSYLAALEQDYRQDMTNLESRFTRNRIRHELLPQLAQQYNPGVVEALLRLGQLAGEAQCVVAAEAGRLREAAVLPLVDGGWQIDPRQLTGQPPYLLREMAITLWRESGWPMQSMGLNEWDRLTRLIEGCAGDSPPVPQFFPGRIAACWDAQTASLKLFTPPSDQLT